MVAPEQWHDVDIAPQTARPRIAISKVSLVLEETTYGLMASVPNKDTMATAGVVTGQGN